MNQNKNFYWKGDDFLIREHISLGDKDLYNFVPLSSSMLLKKEFQEKNLISEYIDAYTKCLIQLAGDAQNRLDKQKNNGIHPIYSKSSAIPLVFLARQVVELSIKYAVISLGGEILYNHNLLEQWKSFCSALPTEVSKDNSKALNDMKEFVLLLNDLDENGTILRYPTGKNGTSQKKFLWINLTNLAITTKSFVEQIQLLIKRRKKV